jgi:hypothetical protein
VAIALFQNWSDGLHLRKAGCSLFPVRLRCKINAAIFSVRRIFVDPSLLFSIRDVVPSCLFREGFGFICFLLISLCYVLLYDSKHENCPFLFLLL